MKTVEQKHLLEVLQKFSVTNDITLDQAIKVFELHQLKGAKLDLSDISDSLSRMSE